MKIPEGGCACGEVRYRLLDKPMRVNCCHCNACQRQTGSAFAVNALIETANIKVLKGRPKAVPVPRVHAPHDIYRCGRCQVAVWSDYGRRPGLRFVKVGTLDDPSALKPDLHIFTRAKAGWLDLPKDAKAFRDYYVTKKEWPAAAVKRLKAAIAK